MSPIFSHYVVRVLVLVGLSANSFGEMGQTGAQSSSVAPGSLAWWAQKAQAEGKTEITLPSIFLSQGEMEPLDDVLIHNTTVVAELIDSETNHDNRYILTWRKFKVVERLARQRRLIPPDIEQEWSDRLSKAPQALLPLDKDQFVVIELGGTQKIDGIKITQPGPGTQVLPNSTKFLMFLIFGVSGKFAALNYGEGSFFRVDDSGTIRGRSPNFDTDSNPLLREMRFRANGNLSTFRSVVAAFQ